MRTRIHVMLLMASLLMGCRSVHQASLSDTQSMIRTEMLFGLSVPSGGEVSDAEWQMFIDEVVTPRFPAGLTIIDAHGQYRENGGRITRENSKLVILLHDRNEATIRKLDEICEEYKRRFKQEAVIRQSGEVWASF